MGIFDENEFLIPNNARSIVYLCNDIITEEKFLKSDKIINDKPVYIKFVSVGSVVIYFENDTWNLTYTDNNNFKSLNSIMSFPKIENDAFSVFHSFKLIINN